MYNVRRGFMWQKNDILTALRTGNTVWSEVLLHILFEWDWNKRSYGQMQRFTRVWFTWESAIFFNQHSEEKLMTILDS